MTISRWFILRMRNVSNESCRENQNTHFMFSDLFPKIVLFMRISNSMMELERTHTIWCLRVAYWLSKPTRVQAHADGRVLAHTHTHGCTHAYACFHHDARAHTRTDYVILICVSTTTMVTWTRLSVTLDVHCVSCLIFILILIDFFFKMVSRLTKMYTKNDSVTWLCYYIASSRLAKSVYSLSDEAGRYRKLAVSSQFSEGKVHCSSNDKTAQMSWWFAHTAVTHGWSTDWEMFGFTDLLVTGPLRGPLTC